MRAVIIDDLIDSAKTICSAANALKAAGASKIWGFVTHAILRCLVITVS